MYNIDLALADKILRKMKAYFHHFHVTCNLLCNPVKSVSMICTISLFAASHETTYFRNQSNYDQLFNGLSVSKLWNYDHYGLLEEVTREFLPSDATIKKLVSEYKSHLSGFYTTTKITGYIELGQLENTESGNGNGNGNRNGNR